MTDLTIKIDGLSSLKNKLLGLSRKMEEAVMAGLFSAGLDIERDAKESVRQKGTGRIYKRGGVMHQASSAGNPPATDTGRLLNSITTVQKTQEGVIEVKAGGGKSQVKYAAMLEFGTSKMAERPFMRPALLKNKKNVQDKVNNRVKKALQDGAR